MRHGRRGAARSGLMDTLSAAASNGAEPLITAVQVAPAAEQVGPQAKNMIDAQPIQRRPDRILGDTAYGNGPARAELAERGADVLVPASPITRSQRGGWAGRTSPSIPTRTPSPAPPYPSRDQHLQQGRSCRLLPGWDVRRVPAEGSLLSHIAATKDRDPRARRTARCQSPSACPTPPRPSTSDGSGR